MRALRLILLAALCSSVSGGVTFLTNATNSATPWTGPPFVSTCQDAGIWSSDLIGLETPGSTVGTRSGMTYDVTQGGWTPTAANAYLYTNGGWGNFAGTLGWSGVTVSGWIKWTGTTASTAWWPVMQLGYTDGTAGSAALYTGLQLYVLGTATTNVMYLCVMFNAGNNPASCGGAGKYISTTYVTSWPSPKSTTGWTHITWAAYSPSQTANGVSVYQLFVNGELVQTQNGPPGTTGLPSFSSMYTPTYTANAYSPFNALIPLGFSFGVSASGLSNQLWVGDFSIGGNLAGNPELAGATGYYYGTACKGSAYDTFKRVTPYSARYISYNYPSNLGSLSSYNLTNTTLAMPASAFTSYDGPTGALTYGSLTPAQFSNALTVIVTPYGFGFPLSTSTSYVQIGTAQDWGWQGNNLNTINYSGPGSSTSTSSGGSGFTVSTWVYRTTITNVAVYTTRLFTVVPNAAYGSAGSYSVSLYDTVLGAPTTQPSAANTNVGQVVMLTWPGCGGAYFYPPQLSAVLNIRGAHLITVAFDSVNSVIVSVDGVQYTYRSSTIANPNAACDLAYSTWPSHIPNSSAYIGTYNVVPEGAASGAYNLIDTTLYGRQLAISDIQAVLQTTSHQGNWPTPPPPPYTAPGISSQSRLAACATAPPAHRYGSAIVNPFDGGVLRDFGTADQYPWATWNASWTYEVNQQGTAPVLSAVTFQPSSVTFSSVSGIPMNQLAARVDFGVRPFYGTGLTIGFLITGISTECSYASLSQIAAADGFPAAMSYFDFGGYSMYTIVQYPNGCYPGLNALGVPNVVTKVTNPNGVVSSFSGGTGSWYSPLQPQLIDRYTFVVFTTTGTTVYVNGVPWASFPTVTYDTSVSPFVSKNTRFFGGNLGSNTMTISDLQIYQRALSAAEVAALSKGISTAC